MLGTEKGGLEITLQFCSTLSLNWGTGGPINIVQCPFLGNFRNLDVVTSIICSDGI